MIWYKMIETIGDYEEGEEYASLPDDILEEYEDSYEIIEEKNVSLESDIW